MNKIIIRQNIEKYIKNYIKETEGNVVYSSVLYHYYNLINHKEPVISYKSFISLFHKVYEKHKNKKLQKNHLRYDNTTLRVVENIALNIPFNLDVILNDKTNIKKELIKEIPKETKVVKKESIIINNIVDKEKEQHSKTMFDANMSEWLVTYCIPQEGNQVKATLMIQHFSDQYLNGLEINGNYNQFFFTALKREAKNIWRDLDIKNRNPSKKKGSAIIYNLAFK